MAVEAAQADAPDTIRPDNAAPAGQSVPTVVAAEAEDEFEQDLTAFFGDVPRWWTGYVRGLGVMRLPLP